MQLEALKERNIRLNNRHLVARISAMQEAASTVGNPYDSNTTMTAAHYASKDHNLQPGFLQVLGKNETLKSTLQNNINNSTRTIISGTIDVIEANEHQDKPNHSTDKEHLSCGEKVAFSSDDHPLICTQSHNSMDSSSNLDILSICAIKSNLSVDNLALYNLEETSCSFINRRQSSKSFCKYLKKKSLRRHKSNTETSLSDGIVMKPNLEALLPASAKKRLIIGGGSSGCINRFNSLQVASAQQENIIPTSKQGNEYTIQTSIQALKSIECSTQTSNVDRFLSESFDRNCSWSPREVRRIDNKLSISSEPQKPISCSDSNYIYDSCFSDDRIPNKQFVERLDAQDSVRLYHSLENLDDTYCMSRDGTLERNSSSRSAQSTPRQRTRLRVVRDPDKARAFILYNLSERDKYSAGVTV